jgi:hypothetical protein
MQALPRAQKLHGITEMGMGAEGPSMVATPWEERTSFISE